MYYDYVLYQVSRVIAEVLLTYILSDVISIKYQLVSQFISVFTEKMPEIAAITARYQPGATPADKYLSFS